MADLARAIRVKFQEEFNKSRTANETVWSLIESDGKQKDGSTIVPQMGRHTWKIMVQPYLWQHQNEWAHEAMVLINWMSPDELAANVNMKGGYALNGKGPWLGMSALHWAVIQGFPCVVNALLNIPEIDINIQDHYGRTPLQLAFTGRSYNVKIVTALIEHGADFNVQDDKGDTPLHTVILFYSHNNSEWLPLMIMDYLTDYNYKQLDKEGNTLLEQAKLWERSEAILEKIQSKM